MRKSSTKNRVVITGIGPLSALGIGRKLFWANLMRKNNRVSIERIKINGELWEKFYLHKIKDFNVNNYGLDINFLADIKRWKGNEDIKDLHYLLVASKLALDDSNLDFNREYNDIGLILAHENPGINNFAEKAFSSSYEFLKTNLNATKLNYFKNAYLRCNKSVYDLQTFMFLFHVGKTLGIHG
ncbi:MAG: hypothetical protein Q7S13_04290, partial [Candidatus Omnitrophota bacterium]|nr:hypothetical protein [Candidatus Omnitrophota bacterium]